MSPTLIRIGTRGSELALVQAEYLKASLQKAHPGLKVDIETVSTAGDRSQAANIALAEIGGKGLFTLEIEKKLSNGEIDMAIHSAKDMPTALPDGLGLVCFPEREKVEDAFLSRMACSFSELPNGAVIGSASLRRRALLLRKRPDLKMVMYRGNVGTRLRKLADGVADATILASAGLRRLGLDGEIVEELPVDEFPPAPGQGALAVEVRLDNSRVLKLLEPLNDPLTATAVTCERAFLEELDGSCRTPIGAHAKIDGEKIVLHGIILKPDGSEFYENRMAGQTGDAREIGLELGRRLKSDAGERFFDGWV